MSKRVRDIATWIAAVLAYYVAFQLFYNLVAFKQAWPYENGNVFMWGLIYNLTPIAIIWALNWLIVFKLVRISRIKVKIAVDAAMSYAMCAMVNMLYLWIRKGHTVDWAGTVFNNSLVLLLLEVYYYVTRYRRTQEQLSREREQALQYQYDALKAQVNPHFLFNSLNILRALVQTGRQEQGLELIDALSQIYRYIVQQQGRDTVPLAEELTLLDNYVSVLQMRYVDQLTVEITGREHVGTHRVVPYTVQLLLENVTKHNEISSRHPMHVTIALDSEGLTMTNPIRPRRVTPTSTGVGLRYLRQLYALHGRQFTTATTADGEGGQMFTAQVQYL